MKGRCIRIFLTAVIVSTGLSSASSSAAQTRERAAPALAQAFPEGLRLSDAVALALKNNPLVKAARSGRDIADARLREAQYGRLPILQFNETFTRSNNPVFVFGSLLEQHRFTAQNFNIDGLNNPDALNNYRSALNLRVPVFDQLETGTRISQARIGQELTDRNTDLVRQQLRLEVIRAFYALLVAEARTGVAHEAVTMAQANTRRVRDLYETGVVVQSDLLSAQVQLSEFRQQRIQADGDMTTSYAALNTSLGLPVYTPQKISGRLTDRNFSPGEPDELIRLALLHRPDYARAGLAVEAAEKEVRGATGRYLPRIDLFSTYGVSGKDLMTSGGPDYAVGAGLTFNLFDLGRGARIDLARAGQNVAVFEREQLADRIRLEVVRSYEQYVSARERLGYADESVAQAGEALRIVQDRYEAGLVVITEVLRAQTAFVRSRLNLLAARFEHYLGYAQILMATGRLTDVTEFD
jgi:outer membrane protein